MLWIGVSEHSALLSNHWNEMFLEFVSLGVCCQWALHFILVHIKKGHEWVNRLTEREKQKRGRLTEQCD